MQTYNAPDVHVNVPSWATVTSTGEIFVTAPGGVGGGGARGPAGAPRGGGGGGASGCNSNIRLLVGDVTTPVTVTIGAAGTAGAGATVDGPGGNGGAGGLTGFGRYCVASGGLVRGARSPTAEQEA
jgi:hypothetical protein